MNRFLLEIGLEEMPSNVILPAVDQLRSLIKNTCENYHLNFDLIKTFSTPRRLTVLVVGLPNKQEDIILELKGPPAEIAKDKEKNWTKSAHGFAKKNEIEKSDVHNINSSMKETLLMAVLGLAKMLNLSANMPSVTGARREIILGVNV